jgi:hypothetical protein
MWKLTLGYGKCSFLWLNQTYYSKLGYGDTPLRCFCCVVLCVSVCLFFCPPQKKLPCREERKKPRERERQCSSSFAALLSLSLGERISPSRAFEKNCFLVFVALILLRVFWFLHLFLVVFFTPPLLLLLLL